MYLEFLSYFFELVTASIATTTWNKYRFTGERNFVYFFWVVFLIEFINYIWVNIFAFGKYYLFYNLLFLFYFIFLILWYSKILNNKKKVLVTLVSVYFFSVVFNLYTQSFIENFQKISFVTGCIVVLFCSFIYFYQILETEEILKVKNNLPFWLTIGNIIYFVGMLPLVLLQEYLNVRDLSYNMVLTIINFITYTCYCVGFLWMRSK